MTAPVELDLADGVAVVTLCRPGRGNAIDHHLARRLSEVSIELTTTRDVRAVLIRGAGSTFCVGGDLWSFDLDNLPRDLGLVTDHLHAAVSRLHHLEVPLVAAVRGSAAGAGLALAIGCDVVVAGEPATFVHAYERIGLTPDAGCSFFLAHRLGDDGRRSFLDAGLLKAADALVAGLADAVVPDEHVHECALALARHLACARPSLTHRPDGLDGILALESRHLIEAAARGEAGALIRDFRRRRRPPNG